MCWLAKVRESRWFLLVPVCMVLCLLLVTSPGMGGKPDKPPGKPPKPGDDEIAPGAVTDLSWANPTHHTVDLTWTATADDGYDPDSGPATSYDIRYTDGTLDDTTWDSASQARGEPAPKTVSSLTGCTSIANSSSISMLWPGCRGVGRGTRSAVSSASVTAVTSSSSTCTAVTVILPP